MSIGIIGAGRLGSAIAGAFAKNNVSAAIANSRGPESLAELTKTRCWVEALALRESMAASTPQWEEQLVLAQHRLSRVPRSLSAHLEAICAASSKATRPEG